MSQELRSAILLLLDERHRVDPARTVNDTEIAGELGVTVENVRRQLDILEAQGLTREANSFEGHSAWISPRGMLATEELSPKVLQQWRAIANLRESVRAQVNDLGLSPGDLQEALRLLNPTVEVSGSAIQEFATGAGIPDPAFLAVLFHRFATLGFTWSRTKIAAAIAPVEKELLRRVAESPQSVFELHPREFEELVAEILDKMGLDVRLTPQTRDGGRDILATAKTPIGELLAVVECKRYSPGRPVDLAIVERMLHTIRDKDRASVGMIVTTSRFTKDAIEAAAGFRWQIQLKDHAALSEWLRRYGTYFEAESSGLWLPRIL